MNKEPHEKEYFHMKKSHARGLVAFAVWLIPSIYFICVIIFVEMSKTDYMLAPIIYWIASPIFAAFGFWLAGAVVE